ncbi:MAG: heavy metal translocating P-type ATPase [Candidatus Eisenbacteria bacterium]|nr:heavy metal translocating P-type ATPase [Candidatus Eisenbacteria bacterium]
MEKTSIDPAGRPEAAARAFKIRGMDCAEEVALLRREIGPLVGGDDRLAFDLLNGRMIVSGAPATPESDILAGVRRAGMTAEPWRPGAAGGAVRDGRARQRTRLTVVSGLGAMGGFIAQVALTGWTETLGHEAAGGPPTPLLAQCLFALAVAAAFWLVAPRAIAAVRRRSPDMNLLMTLAVIGAIALGEWFEAGSVAFLFALSLEMESWSLGRARKAVQSLLDLSPALARRVDAHGHEAMVAPAVLVPGDRIMVRPGERIPIDGVIVSGVGSVNQAPITGESIPVSKMPGDGVFAGSINEDGALTIEASKPLEETTLHHIIRLVEEAQTHRAPAERWVDGFARIYTPVILALATLVAVVPPLLFAEPWSEWIYRALVLLVIGCPCALVISTPVCVVAGLARAARNGVLIKGGAALEAPARLVAFAFDKTGTLTEGRLTLAEVVPMNGHDQVELLSRAAALESASNHPLAAAVLEGARRQGVVPAAGGSHQVVPGKGVHGTFEGREYWLGSHRYLEERGQETREVHERLEALSADGHSVVVIGNDRHVCGFLTATDRLRPEARAVLAELHELGIRPIVLLTGDNRGTAAAIATEAGVDEVQADLSPRDKVSAVETLVAHHGRVAMVGDGINDAPALARATVGIAMGAAGSDAAIETADIALMSDDLAKIPWLVRHSRRTLSVIRTNIALAIGIKVVFLVLTMLGMASLWAAIAADMGVSLLVIANGLTLLAPESKAFGARVAGSAPRNS